MSKSVTAVRPLDGYRIHLRFDDGVEGDLDLGDLAGRGVFECWTDRACFESVALGEGGSVRWSDDAELCPDALYLRLTGKPVEAVFEKLAPVESNA